ncbi:MAG TPA: cation-translocating P-type ATPase [Sphingomicrobium sp.]|nr:cation-translocating P-type ATPase [Sphingomicrobium sp.]
MTASAHHQGLSAEEAKARLDRYGPNRIHEPRRRTLMQIGRDTLREPMFLLLVVAAGLYLLVGDLAEGIFLSAGALLSLSLVIIQEARSEHALQALNALAEPQAKVIRSGETQTIPAAELVPGDLVVIGEGERIPADAMLIDGDVLEVDESILTGESVPVAKRPESPSVEKVHQSTADDEARPALYAGTLIVRGQGVARVAKTGATTEVGRIGVELSDISEGPTLLQRDIRRVIRIVGILALMACALVALAYGVLRNDWFGGALGGLTLAISLVPEEFPMVLTIFMALGALRLARRNVLVRRSAVIETLGATTLLCVDKTGTLTKNQMELRCVWRGGQDYDPARGANEAHRVLSIAQLASALHPHDPMDLAIRVAAQEHPPGGPLRSYPLRPQFLAFSQVWPAADGGVTYAAKGAHEAILDLCDDDCEAIAAAEAAAHSLGKRGMRVLAVASANFPTDPDIEPDKVRYRLAGLLGFADPVRSDVPAALREAHAAGVSVAMITGDFEPTALAIAEAAGIATGSGAVTGETLKADRPIPADARVFARVRPEQKLRLVERFKQAGHVVAMTGDGINDAPALAGADIGIAMGQRGTDVAREAADLILLDDRFASIVGGIRLGRRIFGNLRRAMIYITAVHVPVAGLALLPILIGLPPMLYPMHLVLLELLIDPLCALVFENEPGDPDAMKKPPRKRDEPVFGIRQILPAAMQGSVLLAATLGLYSWLNQVGPAAEVARAAAFTALVIGHLSLALSVTAAEGGSLFTRERVLFWAIGGMTAAVLSLCLALPVLREILRFAPLPPWAMLTAIATGLVAGSWFGLASYFRVGFRSGRSWRWQG